MIVALNLLALASIAGWCLTLMKASAKSVETALLPTCCSILLALFLGGKFGLLGPTHALIVTFGILAFGYWIIVSQGGAIRQLVKPGTITMAAILLAFAWANKGALFILWDEFSHWGRITKFITAADGFPQAATDVLFLDYPFGVGLFHYFFTNLTGFTEAQAIRAHSIFAGAALLTLFIGLKWKDYIFALLLGAFCASFGYLFVPEGFWSNVLIDAPLALTAASAAVIYFRAGADIRAIALSLPVIAALPILKQTGSFYGGVVLCVMLGDILFRAISTRQNLGKEVSLLGICGASLLIVHSTWSQHVTSLGVVKQFSLSPEIVMSRMSQPGFDTHAHAITRRYIDQLITAPVSVGGMTVTLWVAVLLSFAIISGIASRHQVGVTARLITANTVLFAGMAIYTAGLYFLYIFSFSNYEGANTASFERYLFGYIILWLVISLGLFPVPESRSQRAAAITFMAVLSAFTLYFTAHRIYHRLAHGFYGDGYATYLRDIRMNVLSRIGDVQSQLPRNASVYVLWNGTNGFQYYMSGYEFLNRPINKECFSIGAKRNENDVWSCDLSIEEFAEAIGSFDYIFVGAPDELFLRKYGELFVDPNQPERHQWFRSIHSADGAVRLEPI